MFINQNDIRPSYKFEISNFFSTPKIKESNGRENNCFKILKNVLIHEYSSWHDQEIKKNNLGKITNEKLRFLVYTGHGNKSGLGDRLRGIFHAYLCSVISQRLFFVNWKDPFPIEDLFFIGKQNRYSFRTLENSSFWRTIPFDLSSKEFEITRNSSLQYLNPLLSEKMVLVFGSEPETDIKDLETVIERYRSLHFTKKLNQAKCQDNLPSKQKMFHLLFKELLIPNSHVQKYIAERENEILGVERMPHISFSRFQKRRIEHSYTSIHARLGIGVFEGGHDRFNLSKRGISLQEIARNIAFHAYSIEKKTNQNAAPLFYLATDTPTFRKTLQEELKIIDEKINLTYGTWKVRHTKELSKTSSDWMDFMNTFVDLYMLSKGHSLVHIKSGFANLAIWMGSFHSTREIDIDDFRRKQDSELGDLDNG